MSSTGAKTLVLETERLLLRQWRDEDYDRFAQINADPRVMDYFPEPLSRIDSDAMADRCRELIGERGWGLWAVELKLNGDFIGILGLNQPQNRLPCSPCTEIGWRLAYQYWGKGYATEAGLRALGFAFDTLLLDEVVAFTTLANLRSRAVMQRLGMVDTHRNFKHPSVAPDHPLAEHVLYSMASDVWKHRVDSIRESATRQR
jgi:RimJ/RimL family protein N-acetyltransferase